MQDCMPYMQCMFAADWLKRLGPSGAPTIAAINSSHASRWGATLTPLSCGEDRVPCQGIHGRFNTCRCVRVRGAKAGKAGQLTQAKIARTTQRHGDDEGAMTGDPIFYSKINRGYGVFCMAGPMASFDLFCVFLLGTVRNRPHQPRPIRPIRAHVDKC